MTLTLTAEQQQRLEDIVQGARRQALAVLTDEQCAGISPLPNEPFVVAKLTPTFITCETCSTGSCSPEDDHHAH